MSIRKAIDADQARAMGARIRTLRGEVSQAEFATLLGIERATLANYEAGRRIPNDEILKKLSEHGDVTIPFILFGSHKTPFQDYMDRINGEIERRMRDRPGVIPKFSISDDELAIIAAVRLAMMDGHAIEPLKAIVKSAEQVLEMDREVGVPPYSEAQIARLRAALERGDIEEGFDPELALFVTFGEGAGK